MRRRIKAALSTSEREFKMSQGRTHREPGEMALAARQRSTICRAEPLLRKGQMRLITYASRKTIFPRVSNGAMLMAWIFPRPPHGVMLMALANSQNMDFWVS